jgi:hypothetical protein
MGTGHTYRSFHAGRSVPSRYRASYRRLQRIRLRDNWTPEMWWLLIALLVVGVLIATGAIQHPPHNGVSDGLP